MKAIIRNSDNAVIAFGNKIPKALTWANDSNTSIVEVGNSPVHFVSRGYSYSGGWSVLDAQRVRNHIREKTDRQLKNHRDAGVVYSGIDLSTDAEARSLLSGGKGVPGTKKVRGKSGSASMTQAQFDAMVDAVATYIQDCYANAVAIDDACAAANTVAEFDAISPRDNWPTNVIS